MKENDFKVGNADFVKRLIKSQEAVEYFADYLRKQGEQVTVPELRISPSVEEREDYSDNGDLFVLKDGKQLMYEVKHINQDFTSTDDYPYRKIIVNALTGITTKSKIPDYHILLSRDKKYYMSIKSDTAPLWEKKRMWDSYKKYHLWFYLLELDHVDCHEIK